jgi:hypothetical protein
MRICKHNHIKVRRRLYVAAAGLLADIVLVINKIFIR